MAKYNVIVDLVVEVRDVPDEDTAVEQAKEMLIQGALRTENCDVFLNVREAEEAW